MLYRFDRGCSLAPVLEVGAGVSTHQYRDIAVFETGNSVGVGLRGQSETRFCAAGAVLLEYRFRDRWVASVGVGQGGGRTSRRRM